MDCARFEDLLFESLDSCLGTSNEKRMQAHAQACSRCRELAALISGGIDSVPPEVPVDLVAGVLDRTSGGSCGRAQLLLAEQSGLGEDGGLLASHLETCAECAAVARALVQLRHQLPALAELDPGDAFVAEVMAATVGTVATVRAVGAVRPATPPRLPLLVRIEAMWERAVQRPRLALEGAYAGIVLLFLLFGLPSQSLAELPARAFGGIGQEGIKVERAVSSGLGELVELGRSTWADSTGRATEYFAAVERAPRDASRVEHALRARAGAARGLAAGVWDQLLAPIVEHLRALWQGTPSNDVEAERNQ